MTSLKLFFTSIALSFLVSGAYASDTLNKIKKSGTIHLGVRESSIPFSYIDDKQHYIGYSVDLCMKAVAAIQKNLGLSALKVKQIPVLTSTRIPLLANGTVDLVCGSPVNTADRQKQIAFSPTMFIVENSFLSKKASNLKTLSDLKGKTVVTTSGSVNFQFITALNKERGLNMKIITTKDHAEAFLMVETGRAAAMMMDDILLASLIANSKNSQDYVISSDTVPLGAYGLLMRRNDPEFKKVVDNAIIDVFKSGEINRIYATWFESPIPPKGINLHWPMGALLKNAIAHPTDSANLADYKK